jgi:hypothetical protein
VPAGAPRIRNITNALTSESAAPVSGPMAALSLWIEDLPPQCDLNTLAVAAGHGACRVSYIGDRAHDGVTQVNAALPPGLRTGLAPVEVFVEGVPLCPPAWMRLVPAGPAVPRVVSLGDGVNLLSGNVVASGVLKAVMVEVERPQEFRATVGGIEAPAVDSFCVDPLFQRYEFNFPVPGGVRPGPCEVRVSLGRRAFAPFVVEVV